MRTARMGRIAPLHRIAFTALVTAAAAACAGSDFSAVAAERVDSAGIELVTSPAEDRPTPWSYTEAFALGGADEGVESFFRLGPMALASDDDGRIHVLDYASHRVLSFDPAGGFVREVGREGGGPGELQRPAAISATPDGSVSVFDYGKMALVRWRADGEVLPQMPFPHPPSMGGGRHHAVVPGGYLVSTGGNIDGERVQRLIAVAGEDTTLLAAAPQPNQGMVMFESCGGGVSFPPLFTPSIAWDYRDGTAAVAAGAEYRIDIWRDGRIVRSVRRAVPVTAATRELAIAESGEGFTISFGSRGPCTVPPDEYADARGWAETVPAIADLRIDPDGGLWVKRRVPGEEHPPIDRFDADGEYLGTLPAGTPLPALLFRDGSAGVIVRDDMDVDRLVLWRPNPASAD